MIKTMSYWSTPDGLANTQSVESAIDLAKTHGFKAIELCIGSEGALSTTTTQAQCEAIRKLLSDRGVICQTLASGMSWGVNPTSDDPAVRKRAIELHAAALQRAAWLGCEAMLFVPGVVASPIAPDQAIRYDIALDRARQAVTQLLDTAQSVGVDLCIENVWNGLMPSPLEWIDFIDGLKSDRVGMYFDVGNVLGYHQYPSHWVELIGKRIKRVHVKDYRLNFGWEGTFSFCRLCEGQVPLKQSIAALRAIGYDKTVVAEMLPYSDGLLEHTSKAMDDILA